MSWQLASFLIIGAVLVGGFAWYERSRPPSQVVALVAALAALAIAGRVAFAAIPNVKPTTDITIFAGYALGPAPGFAVGALAALVSNFWFGQGPWTPWQMAGWGMCGIFGAALALGGRRMGRIPLAIACGFAGIAYGALLNFSLMATYGGDLSLQRFLLLESRAVPFDAAHAIANVILALVAGPAMIRMLERFRRRFEWRLGAAAVTGALALAIVPLLLLAPARAAGASGAPASGSAHEAVQWLAAAQNPDGGFGVSPGSKSGAMTTAWAMLGLEAAGRNPLDVVSSTGQSPVDYLRTNLDDLTSSGDLARTIVALEGAEVDPRHFGRRNLVADLAGRRGNNGSFEGWPGTTAFSVIALKAAGATGGLDRTLSWLASVQNEDGGWGDTPVSASNPDVTALAMQAMPQAKSSQRGLDYLRKAQRPSGGFPLGGNGEANTQSTAWAVQGMVAVGANPAAIVKGGKSALDYLAARQAADGHYAYSSAKDETPVWVTGEALPGVVQSAFPIAAPPRAPQPSPLPVPSGGAPPVPVTPSSPSLAPGSFSLPSGSPGGDKQGRTSPGGQAPPPSPVIGKPHLPPAFKGAGAQPGSAPVAPAPSDGGSEPLPAIELSDRSTSPWTPVGIALATAAAALASVLFLGRRYGW